MLAVNSNGIRDLARVLDRLGKDGQRAQFRALSDTRRRILAQASRDIRQEYAIKLREVKSRLTATPVQDDSFTVKARTNPIPANKFGAYSQKGRIGRPPKKSRKTSRGGVKVRLKKAGKQDFFAGAFINDKGWIMRRTKKSLSSTGRDKKGRKRLNRLPIRRLYGKPVGDMMAEPDRLQRLETFALETLRANLVRQIGRTL